MNLLYYFLIVGIGLALICCWSCLWEGVVFNNYLFSNRTCETIKPSINNIDNV